MSPSDDSPCFQQQRGALRQQMRARRQSLPLSAQRQAAQRLDRMLGTSSLFLRSRHIAFYLANDGEIDLQPLVRRAWNMGKSCYLPVLSPTTHHRLWFAPYHPDTRMRRNGFGISEPDLPWQQMRPAQSIDLLLAPLVAFDASGNRLGMGGGFYDRTLAYLHQRQHWRKPLMIGTAHAFQQVPSLPHAPWDVPLHGVASDRTLHLYPHHS